MSDPLFWLGLSLLLVAVSLTAVLIALLPTLRELSRAARSAEKLFDTLSRDLPPTLEAIRLTGLELTDLSDDVSESVQSAGRVVRQVDQSLMGVQQQARKAQRATRSLAIGFRAAWQAFLKPSAPSASERARRNRVTPPSGRSYAYDTEEVYSEDAYFEEYSEYGAESYLEHDAEDYSESSYSENTYSDDPDSPVIEDSADDRSSPRRFAARDEAAEAYQEDDLDRDDPDRYYPPAYGLEQYDESYGDEARLKREPSAEPLSAQRSQAHEAAEPDASIPGDRPGL